MNGSLAYGLIATMIASAGCQGMGRARSSTTAAAAEVTAAKAEEDRAEKHTKLGAGDVIEVKVFREPDLAGVYRVNDEGDLVFPLIGKVALAGHNADSLAETIRARLADGYLKDPQVTVFVREHNSQKIHVLGQVGRPGSFPYEPRMTIIDAIAAAGGFTKLAATNRVNVTRVVDSKEQKNVVPAGDIGAGNAPNFQLEPGDIVFVPEALF